MIPKPLIQCYGILIKNLSNHLTNKKKLLGEFIFPIIISGLYVLWHKQKAKSPLIALILGILLKMYISMVGTSAIRELVTLFLNEREKSFRQYQMIFSLGSRCHTLSNLLYMGLYMSFFLVPFYLTLNYFHFDLRYIGVFAAFVISSMACSMMLTSFFTDHKLASEFIGTLFGLSSFLVLMYSGGQENEKGEMVYSAVDRLAMFLPNTSFAIAIIYETPRVSVYSVSIVKIYMIVYSIMEFPHQWKELLVSCWNRIKKPFTGQERRVNILTEEFNLNDQISQSPSMNDRSNVEAQSIMIRISNLVKTYKIKQGQFNALNHVSMTIHKKQIFGLLGRNGAGKTTLVDILTDVCGPSSGGFYINYDQSKDQDLQKIGICYQHQILYEDLTVEQHMYFYCRIKGVKSDYKDTIDSIINMLKIRDEFGKKVKELSGGNKRKLSIAIAVLANPQLMIFDEPTSGLDPLSRRAVWQILQQLKKDFNSSIILTTHHLDEAEVLSDWICVIEKGSVVVQNSPDQIKAKYGNGYYLTLEFGSSGHMQKTLPSVITFLQQNLKRAQVLQKQNNRAKLFLKFGNQLISMKKVSANELKDKQNEMQNQFSTPPTSQSQQHLLMKILQWLNEISDLKIQVEKNSLQQSFIAILKDPQNGIATNNSGDSVQLSNVLQRPTQHRKTLEDYENQGICEKIRLFMSQMYGVFLRCFYFNKGRSLKFLMTYNINIVIFLFAMAFNKFMMQVVQKSTEGTDSDIDPTKFQQQSSSTQSQGYTNNMLILQGYIIMASAFIVLPMYQKEKNIRRVFNSRGVSPLAYWMGNLLFDYGYYLINLFVMSRFITPQSFKFVESTEKGMWLFIELGLGMIVYTYTATTIFTKLTTANTWFSVVNGLFGFIVLPLVIFGEWSFLKYLGFLKYLYPYYDMNVVLLGDTLKGAVGPLSNSLIGSHQAKDQGQFIWYSVGFYFVVLLLIEIRAWDRIKETFWDKTEVSQNDNNIELKNVFKKYGDLEALHNVSYSVNNERLALLGHNGAGKSTTFGLLSGQINPTCGNLFLEKKTKLNHQKIMRSAGICYQEDCLWENCTPLQIFDIFSYLVPIQHSGKEIEWLLQSLEFESMNFNKRFEDLSGGNKRKICMAVGLYGDPTIRLLDECSTGLDPSSRVAMVETIKHSGQGSTIFTTHSMSEAETLCSKTVIMRKGEVLQFDYIYRLKEKYYNCYWVDVVFRSGEVGGSTQLQSNNSFVENNIEIIKKMLKETIVSVRHQTVNGKNVDLYKSLPKILKETKQRKMRLEFDKTVWPIHVALRVAYALRDSLQTQLSQNLIETIYISQPKLQDVYIRLTLSDEEGNQNNEGNENPVNSSKQYVIDSSEDPQPQNQQKPKTNKFKPGQEVELMQM